MARPGDAIVVTKGAAIEATALFAATFPQRLAEAVGADVVAAADALFEQMTVVPEAVVARGFGVRDAGVTSMHDATEGGVLGGLLEVAVASGNGMRIELDAIPVRPEVRAVCEHVGIDPYHAISEGTLIATVVPERADAFVRALAAQGDRGRRRRRGPAGGSRQDRRPRTAWRNRSNIRVSTRSGGRSGRGRPRPHPAREPAGAVAGPVACGPHGPRSASAT